MSIFKAISNLFSSRAAAPKQPLTEQEMANALVKREMEASNLALEAKRLAVENVNKEALKKIEGQAEAKELARQLTATFEQMKQMDKAKKKAEKRLAEADKAWDKQIESNYDLITKLREDYANSLLELDDEEEETQAPAASRRWRNIEAPQPTYIPLTPSVSAVAPVPVEVATPAPALVAPQRVVSATPLVVESKAPEEPAERPETTPQEIEERGTNPNIREIPPVYLG